MRRFALLLAVLPAPLAAQDMMGANTSWTSSQLLLNAEKSAWAAPECVDPARWSVSCGTPRPTTDPAAAAHAFDFRRSAAVQQQSQARFVKQMTAVDPGSANALQGMFQQDLVGLIAQGIKPYGLGTDNVADAMAIYAMEAWEVIAGQVLPPSRARGLAVRAQMARIIADTPGLAEASDADKQMIADEMLYFAALANGGLQGAKAAGPDMVKQWQAATRKGAQRTLGIDLSTMTLTDEGLRPRR
jgi:hypothetical protein